MLKKTKTVSKTIVNLVDTWLIPVTFGVLSVLVLTQAVTTLPSIRQKVDQLEGRFVVYSSSSAFSSSAQQTAYIQLYLSPSSVTGVDVEVMENGQKTAVLSHGSVRVPVHSGSQLEVVAQNLSQTVRITVDHNNPALLRPAPGRTVVLTPQHPQADLPAAHFMK